MKKVLLSTTAVAGLVASSAFAHMDVKLGGYAEFQAGHKNQTKEYNTGKKAADSNDEHKNLTANQKSHKFHTKVQTYVKAMNKSDNGLTYGGVVSIKDNGANSSCGNHKNHIFVEGSFGHLQFGQVKSPSYTMMMQAGEIAAATGGIDGDWSDFVNDMGDDVDTYSQVTSPNLFIESINKVGDNQKHNTIAYYSPKMDGFQLGLSFSPDTATGSVDKDNKAFTVEGTRKNVISMGLTYDHKLANDMGLHLSLVADKASSKEFLEDGDLRQFKNTMSYNLGAKLDYQNMAFAASYGSHGKSGFYKKYMVGASEERSSSTNSGYKKPTFWTLGAAYAQGPMRTSLTYMHSKSLDNVKFNAYSLGVDYAMAPGLMPYAEFTKVKHKIAKEFKINNKNNSASVFLVGAKLTF